MSKHLDEPESGMEDGRKLNLLPHENDEEDTKETETSKSSALNPPPTSTESESSVYLFPNLAESRSVKFNDDLEHENFLKAMAENEAEEEQEQEHRRKWKRKRRRSKSHSRGYQNGIYYVVTI